MVFKRKSIIYFFIVFFILSAFPLHLSASAFEKDVCFVACHPGAGAHFAAFALRLKDTGIAWEILAAENAYKKCAATGIPAVEFYKGTVPLTDLDGKEREAIEERVLIACQSCRCVIVDVGHPFMEGLLLKLKYRAPHVRRLAYVDNPEPLTSGGYFDVARRIMQLADEVLYANYHLAVQSNEIGVGYYPVDEATELKKHRKPQTKVAVYVGGASPEYMERAFPAFLNMLTQASEQTNLSDWTIIFQQHPRAALEYANADKKLLQQWIAAAPASAPSIQFSTRTLMENLAIADVVMYYQTSDSPKFILAGIPAIQVGVGYDDIPVRYGLCPSVQNACAFVDALKRRPVNENQQSIVLDAVGFRIDWFEQIKIIIANLPEKSHM